MTSTFSVRRLKLDETYELRRRVLRNNDPAARVHIREDDTDEAWHLGAVAPDGRILATSSYYPVHCHVRPDAAAPYQLRFMAVDPDAQESGLGSAVLEHAIADLKVKGATLLWANARDTALGFYLNVGFTAAGPSFIEPATGLAHTVVVRELT